MKRSYLLKLKKEAEEGFGQPIWRKDTGKGTAGIYEAGASESASEVV